MLQKETVCHPEVIQLAHPPDREAGTPAGGHLLYKSLPPEKPK